MLHVPTGRGFLADLARLAVAPPAAFAKAAAEFAERWTVLEICEHLLPATHTPATWRLDEAAQLEARGCKLLVGKDGGPVAPFSAWRELSCFAAAALRIARALRRDTKAAAEDWTTIYVTERAWSDRAVRAAMSLEQREQQREHYERLARRAGEALLMQHVTRSPAASPPPVLLVRVDVAPTTKRDTPLRVLEATAEQIKLGEDIAKTSAARQRAVLEGAVNRLLTLGDARPAATSWALEPFSAVPPRHSGGLLVALAVELVAELAKGPRCSSCDKPVDPPPTARPGTRFYCKRCRGAREGSTSAPVLHAQRDYHRRMVCHGHLQPGEICPRCGEEAHPRRARQLGLTVARRAVTTE